MKEPTELAENIWLDEDTETIVISFDDRVTLNFCVQEFWEICDNIIRARYALTAHPGFVVGDFELGSDIKTQIISLPDDENIN